MSTNGEMWTLEIAVSLEESTSISNLKGLQRSVVSGHSPCRYFGETQANKKRGALGRIYIYG